MIVMQVMIHSALKCEAILVFRIHFYIRCMQHVIETRCFRGEVKWDVVFFHVPSSFFEEYKKWEDWRVSGDGSMWTAIGYGEVDAFIIIVLFSGQGPDLTQSTEQVGNKMWKRDRISLEDRWVRIEWVYIGSVRLMWMFRWSVLLLENDS